MLLKSPSIVRRSLFEEKNKTIASNKTTSSHTGNTLETVLNSFLIPANTFITGDLMLINVENYKSGSVGSCTNLIKINTSSDLVGAKLMATLTGTNRNFPMYRRFFINHPTAVYNTSNNTSQSFSAATDINLLQNYGISQRSITVDWTVDQYIMITGTLADITETIINEMFNIQRIRQ